MTFQNWEKLILRGFSLLDSNFLFSLYIGFERRPLPLAPHLLFPQFLDENDKAQRDLGIFFGLVLLGKCDEMWVFGSPPSQGMSLEIAKAKKRSLPIRWFNEQCQEVEG